MTICTHNSASHQKLLLEELSHPSDLIEKPINTWQIFSECLEKCYALSSPHFVDAAFIREDATAVRQMLTASMSDLADEDTRSAYYMIFFEIMQMYHPLFEVSQQSRLSLPPSVADNLTHNASLALESMWLGETLLRLSFNCLIVPDDDPMTTWFDCRHVDSDLVPSINDLLSIDCFAEGVDISVKNIHAIADLFVFSLASFALCPYERPYAALRHFQLLGGSTALVQAHLLFNRSVELSVINIS